MCMFGLLCACVDVHEDVICACVAVHEICYVHV